MLPEVFILGAPKAGTTSLAHHLARHPAYLPALTKELMFLQDLPGFRSNYQGHPWVEAAWGRWRDGLEGLAAYRKFFPRSAAFDALERRLGVRPVTGDHTPFYLYCPRAAERIASFSPEARFVVLLRNPVERAHSDYRMVRHRNPAAERRTFEQAVEDELAGRTRDFRLRYLHQSLYAPALEQWFRRFPRDRFLILQSESFFADPRTAVRETYRFLGLPPFEPDRLPVRNRGAGEPALEEPTRRFLRDHFRPQDRRLFELLERELDWP